MSSYFLQFNSRTDISSFVVIVLLAFYISRPSHHRKLLQPREMLECAKPVIRRFQTLL